MGDAEAVAYELANSRIAVLVHRISVSDLANARWPHNRKRLSATTTSTDAYAVPLTQADLGPIVAAALARWDVAGIPASVQTKLSQARVVVASLPPGELGCTIGSTVYLSPTAAGNGWYIDPTPATDAEFVPAANASDLHAIDPQAVDHIDLLTVVAHELGHVAGLDDLASSGSLMSSTLSTGLRRDVSPAEVDAVLAAGNSG